jgi:periplasmic divalent cation tolerance protein
MGEYTLLIASTNPPSPFWLRRGRLYEYQTFSESTSPNVSSSDPEVVLVLTTITAEADGVALGRALVAERLAACVNILPAMTSVYRWKGQVEQDREQQVIIKTTRDRLPALEARVRELHSYELPEFLVLAAGGGSEAYLAWVGESVESA